MFVSKSFDDTSTRFTFFMDWSLTNGLRYLWTPMAVLETLAVLKRKKQNIDTPEVLEARPPLQPHLQLAS
jgi:hypothetical protein